MVRETITTPAVAAAPAAPAWKALAIAVGMTAALCAFVLCCWQPIYETGDDIQLQRIASGALTGAPSEFLVYCNALLGHLLKTLYTLHPQVNWYPLGLYATHVLAMCAVSYCLLRKFPTWKTAIVYLWLFLCFEAPLLLHPQYTSTAFLAGMGGLFLLAAACAAPPPERRVTLVPAIALLLLSAAIRDSVCIYLLLLGAPLLVGIYLQTRNRAVWLALGIAVAGILALQGYQAYCYRAPAWQAYLRYRDARSSLYDFPGLRGAYHPSTLTWAVKNDATTQAALGQVGWSNNDAEMFLNLLVPTAGAPFDQPALARLSGLVSHPRTVGDMLHEFSMTLFGEALWLLTSLCLLTVVVSLIVVTPRQRWLIGATLAGMLLFECGFAYTAKLPFRLIAPSLWFVSGLCGWYLCSGDEPPLTRMLQRLRVPGAIVTALVLLVALNSLFDYLARLSTINSLCADDARKLYATFTPPADGLVVTTSSGFLYRWLPPFGNAAQYGHWNLITPGAWALSSPLYTQVLQRDGITDMYLALLQRPHTYFCGTKPEAAMVTRYLGEHFHLHTTANSHQHFECGWPINYTLSIYTFTQITAPHTTGTVPLPPGK